MAASPGFTVSYWCQNGTQGSTVSKCGRPNPVRSLGCSARTGGRSSIEYHPGMNPNPLQFLLLVVAGLMNRRQQQVIDYLHAENSVLKAKLGPKPTRFNDADRKKLARMGKQLGRKLLRRYACLAHPETILRWSAPREESESQCPCRKIREVHQRRMSQSGSDSR